jgi:WD40 repeat protein
MRRSALFLLATGGLWFLGNLSANALSVAQMPQLKSKPERKDAFGDVLPEGVFYRLGTARLRHPGVKTLLFSLDGTSLVSHGHNDHLRHWEVATGRLMKQSTEKCEYGSLIASGDGRCFAATWQLGWVVLDQVTGKELIRREDDAAAWQSLAIAKDNKTLVGVSADGFVGRWDLATGKEKARWNVNGPKQEIDKDSRWLRQSASSDWRCFWWGLSSDGTVAAGKAITDSNYRRRAEPWRFWDTVTGKECFPPLTTGPLIAQPAQGSWALSPNGQTLALVNRSRVVEVWSTVHGTRLPLNAGKAAGDKTESTLLGDVVAFDPHGKWLAVGRHGTVTLWDLDAQQRLWHKDALPAERVSTLAFSPDGKRLGVGGYATLAVLETASGAPVGFSQHDPGRFWG